jgi:WD40 repeat protein
MAWNLNTLKAQPLPPDNAEKPLEESKPTLSPDGRLSAKLSGDSKSVTLYDARTGKQMRTLDGRASAISSVIFAPDSSLVATVSGLPAFDGRSKVFLALATVFAGDKKSELDAELNKLTGDRTIKLWDAQTGQLKQTLQCAGVIHQARFLSDGAVVIATHSKAAKSEVLEELMEATGITVWDAETGKTVKTMNAEAQASFLLSPDGSIVISRGRENIRALDARTGELKWETSEVEVSPLSNDPFTPDGKLLVAETKYEDLNSATKLLDVQTGRVRWSLPKKGLTAFSPDGRTLVCFSAYHASLWDLGTGKLNWSIITPQSGLSQPALLRDGKLVAVFGQHYAIELRDARDGRLLVSLLTLPGLGQARENEEATPEWIAFTPEGYYSASPGAARYIRWRVGEKLLPAEAYAKEFNRPDLVQKALQAQ